MGNIYFLDEVPSGFVQQGIWFQDSRNRIFANKFTIFNISRKRELIISDEVLLKYFMTDNITNIGIVEGDDDLIYYQSIYYSNIYVKNLDSKLKLKCKFSTSFEFTSKYGKNI